MPVSVRDTGTGELAVVLPVGSATAVAGAATVQGASGVITSEALTTAAGANYTLTLTNGYFTTTSKIIVTVDQGTNTTEGLAVNRVTPAAGSAVFIIRNTHAATAFNGTIKISYTILNP